MGAVVGAVSVTTNPPGGSFTGPIVLGGANASSFVLTNGGVLPCNLVVGSRQSGRWYLFNHVVCYPVIKFFLALSLLLGTAAVAETVTNSYNITVTTGSGGTTRSVACSGDITSAMNTAISASATGDTVSIGAGSCTMRRLSFSNKNIIIRGQGQGVTNITAAAGFAAITSTGATNPTWRLTGFSLSTSGGNPSNEPVWVWCNNTSYTSNGLAGPFRIDHVDFNYPTSGVGISIYGPCFGVIDHNYFTGSHEHAIWTGLVQVNETGTGLNLWGAYGLSLPFLPGTANNGNYLYIESNTFVGSDPTQTWSIKDTNYTGGRTVIRYNTVTNGMMYSHWTSSGDVNSEWLEVYNNTFTSTSSTTGGAPYPGRMQGGGTGIIHDNTFTGYNSNGFVIGEQRATGSQSNAPDLFCDGTHSWDGNAGDPNAKGWPCLAQTGRNAGVSLANIEAGTKPGSFPLYLWNNGPQAKCSNPAATGAACDNSFSVFINGTPTYDKATPHTVTGGGYGQGDVDYCISASQPTGCGTHTLTYTPYQYPHPLSLQP
jgi:hypothetical protein